MVADEVLYFTSGENRVYAVDSHKGAWKWQYDRESPEGFTIRGYGSPLERPAELARLKTRLTNPGTSTCRIARTTATHPCRYNALR